MVSWFGCSSSRKARTALIERGQANPTWDTLKKIAAALDSSMGELGKLADDSKAGGKGFGPLTQGNGSQILACGTFLSAIALVCR